MLPLLLLLQSTPPASGIAPYGQFLLPVALVVILYFLYFRPMQRHQKYQKEMIKSLQNGQTVVTSGGIIGTIVTVNDDSLILRVKPDNLKLQISRSAVTSVVQTDDQGKK